MPSQVVSLGPLQDVAGEGGGARELLSVVSLRGLGERGVEAALAAALQPTEECAPVRDGEPAAEEGHPQKPLREGPGDHRDGEEQGDDRSNPLLLTAEHAPLDALQRLAAVEGQDREQVEKAPADVDPE